MSHDTPAIPAWDEPDHLAAFRALNPKPGQVFLDHSDRPLAVAEDHNGWYLTTLDGLNQFKPSAVGTFGPMTRARVVPADAIVLDRPTLPRPEWMTVADGMVHIVHPTPTHKAYSPDDARELAALIALAADAIDTPVEPLLTGAEVLDSLADETSVHYLTGLECRAVLGLAQETAPEALAAAIAQVLAQRTTP